MPDEPPPSTPAPPPAAPTQAEGQRFFRHYLLVRLLGRGPLGSAWLVVHEGIGREMAMRFLPDGWIRDEKVIAALQGAVRQSLEITHRGIVSVQDFVNDGTTAAIVTKYVDADSLHEVKTRHTERCFSQADVQPWLTQVAEALDFAWNQHSAVHGDLNPHNVLITRTNEVRVADFGLARSLFNVEGPDGSPLIVGTLAYITPERARGAMVAPTDDVYGFGATVYELLTGRPPFFRGNILWQLSSVVPPTMEERRAEFGIEGEPISADWEEVIAACLAKRPEDRPRNIREVGERLGLLLPLPPAVEPPPPILLPKPAEPAPKPFVPPSAPKNLPVVEYPSSMMTADMLADGDIEPVTMAGKSVAELRVALPKESLGTAPTADPARGPTAEELELTATVPIPSVSPALAETKPPAPAPAPAPPAVAEAKTAPPPPALEKTKPPPPAEEVKPPAPAAMLPAALEKTKPPAVAPSPPPAEPPKVVSAPPPVAAEKKAPSSPPPPMAVDNPKVAPARPASPAKEERKAPAPVVAVTPPAAVPPSPPVAPAPAFAPLSRRRLSWPLLLGGGAAAMLALGLGFLASRRGGPKPVSSTPTPAPVVIATPSPAPVVSKTPVPPPPTPAPQPTLEVRQLVGLADRGPQAERRMLVGKFKVVSAQPPRESTQRVNIILRPTEAAYTGNVRIMASFPPGTRVTEETVLTWAAANEAVVRKVERASDGVNVTVEAAR